MTSPRDSVVVCSGKVLSVERLETKHFAPDATVQQLVNATKERLSQKGMLLFPRNHGQRVLSSKAVRKV